MTALLTLPVKKAPQIFKIRTFDTSDITTQKGSKQADATRKMTEIRNAVRCFIPTCKKSKPVETAIYNVKAHFQEQINDCDCTQGHVDDL